MSYVGKILTLRPAVLDTSSLRARSADFLCVSESDGFYRLIPIEGPYWMWDDIELEQGIDSGWVILDVETSTDNILMLEARIRKYLTTVSEQSSRHNLASRNLASVERVLGTIAVDACHRVNVNEARPSYVGELVFVELPPESDVRDLFGEYIIVQETDQALYGYRTNSMGDLSLSEIRLDRGVKIVSRRFDAAFVEGFICRILDLAEKLDDRADVLVSAECDDKRAEEGFNFYCDAHGLMATANELEAMLEKKTGRRPFTTGGWCGVHADEAQSFQRMAG